MSAFDSIAKKLAIPLVVLFEIGWIVYVGGFGSYMREQVRDGEQRGENADEVLREPVLFPFYFTLVGGQFVALLFLLHAALPSRTASYVVGVLSSILNIIYFVSVGYLIHWSASLVRYFDLFIRGQEIRIQDLSPLVHSVRCILAGTIIMSICWGIVQLLFFFYEGKNASQNRRSLWCVIKEYLRSTPTSTNPQQQKATPGELLRLCVIPVLVLSVVGWCVCIVGLHRLNDGLSLIYSDSIVN